MKGFRSVLFDCSSPFVRAASFLKRLRDWLTRCLGELFCTMKYKTLEPLD